MPPQPQEQTESIGIALMTDLVRELGTISKLMLENQKLLTDVRDLMVDDIGWRKKAHETLEELAGYGEVAAMTLDILGDVVETKRAVSYRDVIGAYLSASAEVFPDDEEDDDDESGTVRTLD